MKNNSLINRLEKLSKMIPVNDSTLAFDVSKLTNDELVFLSDMLKRISFKGKKTTQFDVARLADSDVVQLKRIFKYGTN
jgi:hypothetical protein